MDNANAMLKAVILNPDEDAARLVYADALDERNQAGDAHQASVIRQSIAEEWGVLTLTPWHFRIYPWFGRIKGFYERGLVCEIESTVEQFLNLAERLIWHPDTVRCCTKCSNGYVPTDRDDSTCETCDCKGVVFRTECPPTAQPLRLVRLTTYTGFPIGEQLPQVMAGFRERTGIRDMPPFFPIANSTRYTNPMWGSLVEFELPTLRVLMALNAGNGIQEVEAGASIRQGQLIASDAQGRAVPVEHGPDERFTIGRAVQDSHV